MTTTSYTIQPGQWTLIASGASYVDIQATIGSIMVAVGTSAPTSNTVGIMLLDQGRYILPSVAIFDNVYAIPTGSSPINIQVTAEANATGAFTPLSTVVLTSTTSSQTTTVPANSGNMVAYNGGTNTVYLTFANSLAVPTTGTWTASVIAVQPGTTQTFTIPPAGGTLAYIAETAGGELILSVGQGV